MFTTTLETVAPLKLTVWRLKMESVLAVFEVLTTYELSPLLGSSFTHLYSFAVPEPGHPFAVPTAVHCTVSPFPSGRSFVGEAGAVFTSWYLQYAVSSVPMSVHVDPQFPWV